MDKRTDLKIPCGIADFKRIRNEGWYYVDKTEYLAKLEGRDSFVFFVRPRRFGKSLFISMMQCYYDRREEANFEQLFGGLWLGEHRAASALRGGSIRPRTREGDDASLDSLPVPGCGTHPARRDSEIMDLKALEQ